MISIDVNEVAVVTIGIRLMNIHNSQEILRTLKETAKKYHKNIVINLEKVELMDSTTIAMFVEYNNFLKENGLELTFTNLSPFIKKIFNMLHISTFFNIK
jgi:anti-anti-sigma factor